MIEIVKGEIFTDFRGRLDSVNSLPFEAIKRFYIIKQERTDIIRGWHGHQTEDKWFYCVQGSFRAAFVKIDDWVNPSKDLFPKTYLLSDRESCIIHVPAGYANCFQALEKNSHLLVFSSRTYPTCLDDSWRYDVNYWGDWESLFAK